MLNSERRSAKLLSSARVLGSLPLPRQRRAGSGCSVVDRCRGRDGRTAGVFARRATSVSGVGWATKVNANRNETVAVHRAMLGSRREPEAAFRARASWVERRKRFTQLGLETPARSKVSMYSYYSSQQQQQQQPLQTLPSSPVHHLTASSSSSSSTPAGIQFGLVPGSQPGVLGWGIGMSSANGAGFGFGSAHHRTPAQASGSPSSASTSALGWGAAAAASSSSRPASPSSAAVYAGATPTPNSRRRRRSPSPEQHGTESGDDEHMSARKIRPLYSANSKRARMQPATAGGGASGDSSFGGGSTQQQQQVVVGDLGKALGALSASHPKDYFI